MLIRPKASGGGHGGVWIHQVSRRHSQAPFKKIKGSVQLVLFHPSKPHLFVAVRSLAIAFIIFYEKTYGPSQTQRYVRIYNLSEQKLLKMLTPGIRWISSMDVHPSGDHLIVGGYDRKLCWFDLELSEKPYKILRYAMLVPYTHYAQLIFHVHLIRYHSRAIRSLHYHPSYPLFASSSDDGSIQIFHARVYSDLLTDPLIIPLKILRGHDVREGLGVLQVKWVPKQPWLVSAGADSTAAVWCH
jgi:ribosome biogenesis protein ERB1